MKQQVNLYHPMFRKQRHLLSSVAMVQAVVAMTLGLAGIGGYAAWQLARLGAEHEQIMAEQASAERRLVQLEQKIPKRTKSRRIAEQRARLERQRDLSRELLETMSRRTVNAPEGFADFLQGLARQRVEGLWLTGFEIADSGRHLEIAGSALRPELVPVLVQRLSAEPTFHGVSFRSLTIDRPESAPRRVDFVLHTVPKER